MVDIRSSLQLPKTQNLPMESCNFHFAYGAYEIEGAAGSWLKTTKFEVKKGPATLAGDPFLVD